MRPTAFLSYSHADQDRVRVLASALEQAGIDVWWDTLIEGGAVFAKSVEVALARCDAVIVAWHVKPGQRISAHVHPEGQDTWTIISGRGEYQVAATGESTPIVSGDVVVAHRGEVHGVYNNGSEPLVFVSVVSPAASGFEPL